MNVARLIRIFETMSPLLGYAAELTAKEIKNYMLTLGEDTPHSAEILLRLSPIYPKSKFILKLLDLKEVISANEGQGLIQGKIEDEEQRDKIEAYKDLRTQYPPIVINVKGEILDGFHRVRVLEDKNEEDVWAYVETEK